MNSGRQSVTDSSACDASASVTSSPECGGCGKPFTPARKDARYCSARCRQAAYRERHQEPKPSQRRRPVTDSWRDAVLNLRRAAERVDRLTQDPRFAANFSTLHVRYGPEWIEAAMTLGGATAVYGQLVKKLPARVRRSVPITRASARDASGPQELPDAFPGQPVTATPACDASTPGGCS